MANASSTENLADALARAGPLPSPALHQAMAKAHPDDAPALNNVAFFLADTGGDLDEALRLVRNALAKMPGQPSFSDTIGYIYLKKGMLDSALQSFSTLARKYPTSASFRYHFARALLQKGDKAVARKELSPHWRITLWLKKLCESGSCSMGSASVNPGSERACLQPLIERTNLCF